jgi:hypothetical protein
MRTKAGKWLPAILVAAGLASLGLPRSASAVTVEFSAVIVNTATGAIVGTIAPTSASDPTLATVNTSGTTAGLIVTGGNHNAGNNSVVTGIGEQVLQSTVTSVANNSGITETAYVVVSGNNFVGPTATIQNNLTGSFNQAGTTSSITASWYDSTANGLSTVTGTVGNTFNPSTNLSISGTQVGTTYSYTSTGNTLNNFGTVQGPMAFANPNPFGMTLLFAITFAPNAVLQSRQQSEIAVPAAAVVPEPAPVILALTGLPMLGLVSWRRRRRA